jgi:hypothetical protein
MSQQWTTETNVSTIFASLCDHPLLRRLSLLDVMDLTGLETLLLSDASKITELDIDTGSDGPPMMGLTPVLKALAQTWDAHQADPEGLSSRSRRSETAWGSIV